MNDTDNTPDPAMPCYLLPGMPFPPVEHALTDPDGLLAIGTELTPARVLQAYRLGIFPWYNDDDPVLWWSPNPRMVLFPAELHVSASLRKRIRKGDFQVTFNQAFRQVILGCAETVRGPDHCGTWITPEILETYCSLHDMGYGYSVETWMDGQLAGGLYGIKIGRVFFGESMFQRATDASRIAFVHLVAHMKQEQVELIDCQMSTPHLASLGAREIPREEFTRLVRELTGPA